MHVCRFWQHEVHVHGRDNLRGGNLAGGDVHAGGSQILNGSIERNLNFWR